MEKSITTRFVMPDTCEGIVPVIALLDSFNFVRETRLPIDVGIGPFIDEYDISTFCRPVSTPNEVGSLPVTVSGKCP